MGAEIHVPVGQVLKFPACANQAAKGGTVDRINQFEIYEMGQTLQKVRAKSGESDPTDFFFEILTAQGVVRGLLDGNPMTIGVSETKARELLQSLNNMLDTYFYPKDDQGNTGFKYPDRGQYQVKPWEWSVLTSALEKFETVFAEEMREASAYVVPQRGITSTKMLVEHGERAFQEDLVPFIGIKAIADFKAAARCYAFDLYTASGYHSARSVEAVLETYYQTFLNKPGHTLKGWNEYVEALKKLCNKKPKPKHLPDSRTLLSVDEIRFHHRNPLMHPRATLTETDADMLLSIAKVAMIAMAQEIQGVWKNRPAIAAKIKAKQVA